VKFADARSAVLWTATRTVYTGCGPMTVAVQFANVKVGTSCSNSRMKEAFLSWHPSDHVSLFARVTHLLYT
jgi:hypothetical protein